MNTNEIWAKQPLKIWSMYLNFILGIIPGIVYILRNVFIHDEIAMNKASIKNSDYWIYVLIFGLGLVQNAIDIFYYKRYISVSLIRSKFIGQILSLILLFASTNDTIISFLRNIVKQKINDSKNINKLKKLNVVLVLLVFCSLFFVVYKETSFSELLYR